MRTCIRCSCTEGKACLEFDADGYAHACYWFSSDLCSACAFLEHVEPPEADEGVDTRLTFLNARDGTTGPLRVTALAGMVARPRTSGPQPRKRRRS